MSISHNQFTLPDGTGKVNVGHLQSIDQRLVSHFEFEGKKYQLSNFPTLSSLRSLKHDWQALEKASQESFDYFQSYDWCANWAESFLDEKGKSEDYALSIYVLRDSEDMIMLWPFMISVAGFGGVTLQEPLTDPLGQYANVLVDRERVSVKLGREVWNAVKADRQADAIVLNHFSHGGFLAQIVEREGVEESVSQVSSILDYSKISQWDQYIKGWSKSQRKQQSRARKKLEALGSVKLEVLYHDDPAFSAAVSRAVRLKRIWLKETNRQSQMLFVDESEQFLMRLGSTLTDDPKNQGPLVFMLTVGGNPIAFEIGLLRNNHYYSYLGVIDLAYKDYSPGKVQIEMAQKWAFEQGYDCFDFLSDPSDYKSSWSNRTEKMHTRYFPLSYLGAGYCNMWKARMRPALKKIYHHASPNVRKSLNRLLKLAGRGADEKWG